MRAPFPVAIARGRAHVPTALIQVAAVCLSTAIVSAAPESTGQGAPKTGAAPPIRCESLRQQRGAIASEIAQAEEQLKLTSLDLRKRAVQQRLDELRATDQQLQTQLTSCSGNGPPATPPRAALKPAAPLAAPPPVAAACGEPMATHRQLNRDAAGLRINISAIQLALGEPTIDPKVRTDLQTELAALKKRQADVGAQILRVERSLQTMNCTLQ